MRPISTNQNSTFPAEIINQICESVQFSGIVYVQSLQNDRLPGLMTRRERLFLTVHGETSLLPSIWI